MCRSKSRLLTRRLFLWPPDPSSFSKSGYGLFALSLSQAKYTVRCENALLSAKKRNSIVTNIKLYSDQNANTRYTRQSFEYFWARSGQKATETREGHVPHFRLLHTNAHKVFATGHGDQWLKRPKGRKLDWKSMFENEKIEKTEKGVKKAAQMLRLDPMFRSGIRSDFARPTCPLFVDLGFRADLAFSEKSEGS